MSSQGSSNSIWSIADQLRGVYKPSQYGTATLPFLILRRMECVMGGKRDEIRAMAETTPNPSALGRPAAQDVRATVVMMGMRATVRTRTAGLRRRTCGAMCGRVISGLTFSASSSTARPTRPLTRRRASSRCRKR